MEREGEETRTTMKDEAEGKPLPTATEVQATVSRLESDLKDRTTEVEALNDRLLRRLVQEERPHPAPAGA